MQYGANLSRGFDDRATIKANGGAVVGGGKWKMVDDDNYSSSYIHQQNKGTPKQAI
jgi:hypothetical protein